MDLDTMIKITNIKTKLFKYIYSDDYLPEEYDRIIYFYKHHPLFDVE